VSVMVALRAKGLGVPLGVLDLDEAEAAIVAAVGGR